MEQLQESREAWARWLRDPNRSHNPNAFALIADLLDGFAEQPDGEFLDRVRTALAGVICVSDQNTAEFDAARSCLEELENMRPPIARSVELGPDGKEWAKTEAGYKHVESMMAKADGDAGGPYWHGWALRGAFVAGAEWQEGRHITLQGPSPSEIGSGTKAESDYKRGYRQGYERRDAEVRGALV